MKKIVFVCSHFYSGSSQLCAAMDENQRIQRFNSEREGVYESASDLFRLTQMGHKISSSAAIYMDELLHNYQLSTRDAYGLCRFIYVVREPAPVISYMQAKFKIMPAYAARYYLYRMRRICEMARRTPGAVLLTFDDLKEGRCSDIVSDYLSLKQPVEWDPSALAPVRMRLSPAALSPESLAEVEQSWERYLYFLRNQALRTPR